MRRPAPLLLGLLYYGALIVSWLGVQQGVAQLWTAPNSEPAPIALLPLAALLALVAAVGRVLLACLPAGEPGGHGPRKVLATWAASHALGCAALAASAVLVARFGWRPHAAWLLAPWGVAAGAQLVLRPGDLRPRHEAAPETAALHARLAWPAALLLLGMPLVLHWARGGPVSAAASPAGRALSLWCDWIGSQQSDALLAALAPWHWLALGGLLAHGLHVARRDVFGRRSALMLFALAPGAVLSCTRGAEGILLALWLGLGAAGLVGWLRRADRRALWMSCLGFAASALCGTCGVLLAFGGLTTLVAATARAARSSALLAVAACALLVVAPNARLAEGLEQLDLQGWGALVGAATNPQVWGFHWMLAWLALVLVGLRWALARRGGTGSVAGENSGRELPALVALMLFGFSASALAPLAAWESWSERLVPLLAPAALTSALVLVRSERFLARRAAGA